MSRSRTAAAALATARLAYGIALFVAPERVASGWLGKDVRRAATKIAVHGLAARDIAHLRRHPGGAARRGRPRRLDRRGDRLRSLRHRLHARRPGQGAAVQRSLGHRGARRRVGHARRGGARWVEAMRIAVVGAGISGLVAAHHLHPEHDITVYEANGYVGGHTSTHRVDLADETHWVDTGFIVYNDRNYPNFEPLLAELGVETQPSHMSFSVSDDARLVRVREHAARPVRAALAPGGPPLPAHGARPAALQPRGARRCWSWRPARGRRCASSCAKAATRTGSCSG